MNWTKTSKHVTADGTTIIYKAEGTGYTIESRKRHIPHANRSGTWDHTTYHVLHNGQEIKERYSLRDAKAWAEESYSLMQTISAETNGKVVTL